MSKEPWRRGGSQSIGHRSVKKLNVRQTIYIFTTGAETERNYFISLIKHLRLNTVNRPIPIKIKRHCVDPELAARKVVNEINNHGLAGEFWLVFDVDPDTYTADNISRCQSVLTRHEIGAIYSNRSFELWFILHYCQNPSVAWVQADYEARLTSWLGRKYNKNGDLFTTIFPQINEAIKRSKDLLQQYSGQNIYQHNPSTKVHVLVERLMDLINFK